MLSRTPDGPSTLAGGDADTSPGGRPVHRYGRSEALRVLNDLRSRGDLPLPRDVNTDDPALLAAKGEVDIEKQLAARAKAWTPEGGDGGGAAGAASALGGLSLDGGRDSGRNGDGGGAAGGQAAGGDNATRAAEGVAASAAAGAAPAPAEDEWFYQDPKGQMQVCACWILVLCCGNALLSGWARASFGHSNGQGANFAIRSHNSRLRRCFHLALPQQASCRFAREAPCPVVITQKQH